MQKKVSQKSRKLETDRDIGDALNAQWKRLATGPMDTRSVNKMLSVIQKKQDEIKRRMNRGEDVSDFFRK